MATIDGRIILVQESRFQLVDGHGVAHLFLLASSSAAESWQLGALAARQAAVRVTYRAAPNALALLAARIDVKAMAAADAR